MASKEVYSLKIGINVTGDKKAKRSLSDLESTTEKVEKKLKKLSDVTASPNAKIKDKATSTIDKIDSKVKKLSRATGTAKLQAKDNASVVVQKVMAKTEQLNNKKIKPKLSADDKASSTIDKVEKKAEKLEKTEFKAKLKAQDNASNVITKAENKLKSWLKSGAKKVISIGVAGTVALGGMGVSTAVKTFSDFEYGMKTVQATAQASNSELQILTDTAKHLGATTSFSAVESAEAMNYLAI